MDKESIRIVTDTASSCTQREAVEKRINLVPLYVNFSDGSTYTDFTLSSTELYRKIKNGDIPTTASPNPDDFINTYQSLYDEGARKIMSIHLSSANSGTLQSAKIAADEISHINPDLEIKVIDSKALCLAQAFKVEAAQNMVLRGLSLDQIEANLDKLSGDIRLFSSTGPDAAEYLKKSGRMKGLAINVASALKIVPIVTLNEDGAIVRVGQAISEKKGRKMIVELLKKEIDIRKSLPKKIGIAFTDQADVGLELKYLIEEILTPTDKTGIQEPVEAGSVLGAHTGHRSGVITALWE